MKSNLLILGLIPCIAFVAGCGTEFKYVQTNPTPKPLREVPAEDVVVLTSDHPSEPYAEIGILAVEQRSRLSNDEMPQIIKTLRRKAGKRGCEGVLIQERTSDIKKDHWVGGVASLEGYRATCIVFLDYGEGGG